MAQTNINLYDERDITTWLKGKLFDPHQPNDLSVQKLRDKDYVLQKKNMIAAILIHDYIRSYMHQILWKYADTDFLTLVSYDENLSQPIKDYMAAGSKVHQTHMDKLPEELNRNIDDVKKHLFSQVVAKIEHSVPLAKEGSFAVDMKSIRKSLPEFEAILKQIALEHATSAVKKQQPTEKQPPIIQKPDMQND